MTQEDQVFIVDVVVTDLMREAMVSNVISRSTSAIVKLSAIVKIHKYRRLHEKHHFTLMAVKMHNTLERDMDHFMKECACFFHDRRSRGHLSLSFCIQFFR
jgi:hypothetical protein